MSKQKRCLVLGANGFIGSHIVDSLVGMNYKVIAYDRFSHTQGFKANDNISLVKGDIFDADNLASSLVGVDYVFHCFSATTPYTSDNDPYSDITQNLLNSVKIFELCAKANIQKLIYISSGGSIYGETAEYGHAAREDDPALPISPYGISKLATERYLAYFKRKYNLDHLIYRLSNPYGPRQMTKHNQGVVPRFIENISAGETISLYGDGTSARDYIFIEDAVRLISETFQKRTRHTIYNLGSGQPTTLEDMIHAIEHACGTKAKVEYVDEPLTFVHKSQIDVTRFRDEFHLEAHTSLNDGILKTVS